MGYMKNHDIETLHKLCDVLDVSPIGLTEITIKWDTNGLVTYTTTYINEVRAIKARKIMAKIAE